MTAEIIAGTTVTPAVARAWIDRARQDDYRAGVLGLLASPEATRHETFAHDGQPVRIVTAASVLAVHQAIRDAVPGGWLIIVTDRSESDLGPGLLAHFVWHRLRHPDAWQGVAQRFGAFSIDPRLNADAQARNRALASGLLELSPVQGWPAAPAGVLTRDHAFGCVARFGLGLPEGPIDLVGALHWSTTPGLPGTIARLRSRAGDPLVDAVLDWVAEQAGEGRDFVAALLRGGTASDLVPLGVVLDCLFADGTSDAHLALARLQHRWGQVPRPALAAVGRLSCVVVSGLLGGQATSAQGRALISRADDLLVDAGAVALAGSSRLLSAGLTMRLRKLAGALDAPTIDLSAIEPAWLAVSDHQLVDDPRLPAARAGVRLARWLSTGDAGGPATLATLTARHLEIDGWVDSAVNDAEAGVDDHALAAALERVLDAVRGRRDSHDLAFASAIAREGCDERAEGVLTLERLLPEIVLPLAKRQPTLLLVLDGMSVSVAVEIMGRVGSGVEFGLVECLLPGASERTAALAALPSVTEASRTSLLTGRLASGQQDAERAGFKSLARSHGLAEAPLFHKRLLDSGRGCYAL
ncbi:MAG TPA: BREX-2 system phosphatase PglZ, partial [Arachnia sp.]|nr:BREX-2 system phosphatase PglZ [Arachnia sp.]